MTIFNYLCCFSNSNIRNFIGIGIADCDYKADTTVVLRTLNENVKDMAIANSFKVAGSLAAIGGVAQFLTAEDET